MKGGEKNVWIGQRAWNVAEMLGRIQDDDSENGDEVGLDGELRREPRVERLICGGTEG